MLIHAGTVKSDSHIHIGDERKTQRPGQLHKLQGAEHAEIEEGMAGDVVAMAKLDAHIGDLMRAEPKNVGVIYRSASGPLKYQFWTRPPFLRDPQAYQAWVTYWVATIEKHGTKCLHWLPKRRPGESFYIDFAGAKLITGEADVEALYARLVDTAGFDGELEDDLEPEKMPGWWKK